MSTVAFYKIPGNFLTPAVAYTGDIFTQGGFAPDSGNNTPSLIFVSKKTTPDGISLDADGNWVVPYYYTGSSSWNGADGDYVPDVTHLGNPQPGQFFVTNDGSTVVAYDSSIYPSPVWAQLDFLTSQGNSKGLATAASSLSLDPVAVLNALQAYCQANPAGDQANTLQYLGSPAAFLQAVGIGNPSLAPIVNPWVAAHLSQLNAGQQFMANQWLTGHPSMSDHTMNYVAYVVAIASVAAPAIMGYLAAAGGGSAVSAIGTVGATTAGDVGASIATAAVNIGTDLSTTVLPSVTGEITAGGTLGAGVGAAGEPVLTATVATSAPVTVGADVIVTIDPALGVTISPLPSTVAPLPDLSVLPDVSTLTPTTNTVVLSDGGVYDLGQINLASIPNGTTFTPVSEATTVITQGAPIGGDTTGAFTDYAGTEPSGTWNLSDQQLSSMADANTDYGLSPSNSGDLTQAAKDANGQLNLNDTVSKQNFVEKFVDNVRNIYNDPQFASIKQLNSLISLARNAYSLYTSVTSKAKQAAARRAASNIVAVPGGYVTGAGVPVTQGIFGSASNMLLFGGILIAALLVTRR